MQNVIIGTAGHIDHGKTTLIKALTGRSTDKLKEEIKRGISINLGFTYFDLPSGKRAGIVDVPGHERFIKNMLAGASGIDIVLLAIAANEGVKPQTMEHIDILSYLDIKERVIVLTKCGIADEEMKELVLDDINDTVSGTFFDSADIIEVDSISGMGLNRLIEKIDKLADNIKTKNERAAGRLHVDRVFSMKGFGTIVTGTLSEGTISRGEELMLYPKMLSAKIRNVQVHEETVDTAYAGQRTALNISNIKWEDIRRGDVLAAPLSMENTTIIDAKISLVKDTDWTLKLWDRVRVYMGASEVLARVVPLDKEELKKGESAYCQLRLEIETACKKNDRLVLRTFSPLITIGGGIVLDSHPKKHGKADKLALEALKIRDTGDMDALIEDYIRAGKEKYVTVKDLCDYVSIDEGMVNSIVERLIEENAVIALGKYYFHIDTVESFNTTCIKCLSEYHNKYPLRKGILKEELKSKTTSLRIKEFDALIKMAEDSCIIKVIDNSFAALYNFEVIYSDNQLKIKNDIETALLKAGFSPPPVEAVTNGMKKEHMEVFESLAGGTIVKLDAQTAIHKDYYNKAMTLLTDFAQQNGKITLAEFRDLINSSRKYAVLLLDDFDKTGLTQRLGDLRVLKIKKN